MVKELDRRLRGVVAALAMLCLLCAGVPALGDGQPIRIETTIANVRDSGNVSLKLRPRALRDMGLETADVISVDFGDRAVEMPVCEAASDVSVGRPACLVTEKSVVLCWHGAEFAAKAGIADRVETAEAPGFAWVLREGFGGDAPVTLTLVEKQGYRAIYDTFRRRSDRRGDYPTLTDAQYANFRMVATAGIAPGVLYRSSSPVNPALNRNREADRAMAGAGVKTVVNLGETREAMEAFEGYSDSYYAGCDVAPIGLGLDFSEAGFHDALMEGYRHMLRHDGPYLIHCRAGKDRTGLAVAVLECLMGAGTGEVVADFMVSFENFYGVEPGSEVYRRLAEENIQQSLATAFGVDALAAGLDLAACAEKYLLKHGMTGEEIDALCAMLSGKASG